MGSLKNKMEDAWTEYWRKEIIDGGPDKKSTEWYCWGKVLTNWSTGDSLVVEVSYPACPGPRDKVRPVCQIFFGTSWSRKQEQKLWNIYKHNFTVRASGESGKDVYVIFPDSCYYDILISRLISFSLKVSRKVRLYRESRVPGGARPVYLGEHRLHHCHHKAS